MSESRRLFNPRLFLITNEQDAFIRDEAVRRNPAKRGGREQNGVVRDVLDFAIANHPLFLSWLATRGTNAADEQEEAA